MKQSKSKQLLSKMFIVGLVFSQVFMVSPIVSKAKAARSYVSFEKSKYEASISKLDGKDVLEVRAHNGLNATLSFALNTCVGDHEYIQNDYNTISSTQSNDTPYLVSDADKYKLYFPETDDENEPTITLESITDDNSIELSWDNPDNSKTRMIVSAGDSCEIDDRSETDGEIVFNINGVVAEGEYVFNPTNSNECSQDAKGLFKIGFTTEAGVSYIRITSGDEARDVNTIVHDRIKNSWAIKPENGSLEGYYIEYIPDKSKVPAEYLFMLFGDNVASRFEKTEQFPNGAISLANFPSAMYDLTMIADPIKQTITVSSPKNSKTTVKASKLKKSAKKITIKASAKTTIKYSVSSTPKGTKKSISLSKKSGKKTTVTLKKGAKKGTYKIKLTAPKGNGYAKASKTVTIIVK